MKKLWSGIKSIVNFMWPILLMSFYVHVGNQTERSIPKSKTHFSHFLKGNFNGSLFLTPVSLLPKFLLSFQHLIEINL